MIDMIIWALALISIFLIVAGAVAYAIILLGGYDELPASKDEPEEIENERWEDL